MRSTRWRPLVAALLALGLAIGATACGSSDEVSSPPATDGPGTTGAGGETTEAGEEAVAVDYSERGPYEAGFATLDVDGTEVFLFYPADPTSIDDAEHVTTISSDVAFPEEFREIVPDFFVQELPVDHHIGAAISDEGPFGILLHSHGASGHPLYAASHLEHAASWGYVVAAPSHPSRNLAAAVGGGAPEGTEVPSDVDDLVATLDRLEAEVEDPDSVLFGAVDVDLVAAEGHSAGGRASLQLAMADDRVLTVIGQAPAPPVSLDQLVREASPEERAASTAAALAEMTPPAIPTLIVPGERDGVIPLEPIQALYEWLAPPKQLVVVANAGHNPFLDICAPVRAQGGLVDNAGDLVEAFGPLLRLGEDGCVDGYLEPELGYLLANHLTVAQLRWVFGQDPGPASLSAEALEAFFPEATGEVEIDR